MADLELLDDDELEEARAAAEALEEEVRTAELTDVEVADFATALDELLLE